jgi:hypothetical protein
MDKNQNPMRSQGVPWQIFGEGVVVMQTQKSAIFEFNETAAWIWQAIDGQMAPAQIAEKLTQFFDITPNEAKTDVDGFLSELQSESLITWT